MSYSHHQRSQPPRAIRAGLSVQELKAMTAARMAQSGDPSRTQPNHNPATSYQTANPQQLQAAGITPVVINDRTRNFRRGNSVPSFELAEANQPLIPKPVGDHSAVPNQHSFTQLSPYHQQLLPSRSPLEEYRLRDQLLEHDGKGMNSRAVNYNTSSIRPNDRSPLSEKNTSNRAFYAEQPIFSSFETYPEVSPRSTLPSLNSTPRHAKGPEVRSPSSDVRRNYERPYIPDEESELYNVDSLFVALNVASYEHSTESPGSLVKRPPLSRAYSNPVLQADTTSFTNAGVNVINSGFLPAVSTNLSPAGGRSDGLFGEDVLIDSSSTPGKTLDRGPFPFKKSKTAPKLGVIASGTISPVDSPNLKLFGRKHLGHPISLSPLRDRAAVDNFLASEMAESVLDTPSTGSTPLGRKFFQQPEGPFHLKRGLSNTTLQPIDLTSEKTLTSHEVNNGLLGPPVSNQCDTDDSEKFPDPAMFPDSANSSPRYFMNSRVQISQLE